MAAEAELLHEFRAGVVGPSAPRQGQHANWLLPLSQGFGSKLRPTAPSTENISRWKGRGLKNRSVYPFKYPTGVL